MSHRSGPTLSPAPAVQSSRVFPNQHDQRCRVRHPQVITSDWSRLCVLSLRSLLAAVSLAATVAGLAVPAAAAQSTATWTVTPGGVFRGTDVATWLIDAVTGAKFNCHALNFSSYLKSGTGLPPKIGKIGSIDFSSPCTGEGLTLTITGNSLPWGIRAAQYDPATDNASGTILGVQFAITGSTCTADLTGHLRWTYTRVGSFTNFAAPRTLTAANVTGCAGAISGGDTFNFYAHEASKPRQVITSP